MVVFKTSDIIVFDRIIMYFSNVVVDTSNESSARATTVCSSAHQIFKTFVVITKTHLYNSDPLGLHFYILKLGFTGVYIIFLISA